MLDAETTIVPLDAAQKLLSTFGVGPEHQAYQRWRRDDGFRLVDLEDVLVSSKSILGVDWRDPLEEAVGRILDQLAGVGISAKTELTDDGCGSIEIDGQREPIKFVSSDDDDFDRVICGVNSLIVATAQYRKLRSSEGSDGWWYGLLFNDDWRKLDSTTADLTRLLFAELGAFKIDVVEGDLLDQDVDVIVNAWNRNIIPWWLLLPQGVSGAIKRRGGARPFKELARQGPMPLGSARLTSAGRLPFKGIIHVAGINLLWRATERSIRDSVGNALRLAHQSGFTSIAFPLIGAGSGGFNEERAKAVMLDELDKLALPLAVKVVVFKRVRKGLSYQGRVGEQF